MDKGLSDKLTEGAATTVKAAVNRGLLVGSNTQAGAPMAEALARTMQISVFGVRAGHQSVGKFELNEMGCLRIRTRSVALFSPIEVDKYLARGVH